MWYDPPREPSGGLALHWTLWPGRIAAVLHK
jgi:hypothetical protein